MSRARAKGTAFETRIVADLKAIGITEVRRTPSMTRSVDITFEVAGLRYAVECKHRKTWSLSVWWRDLVDAARDQDRTPWLVVAGDLRSRSGRRAGIVVVTRSAHVADAPTTLPSTPRALLNRVERTGGWPVHARTPAGTVQIWQWPDMLASIARIAGGEEAAA